jgi:sugar lactone lactonase YvrE
MRSRLFNRCAAAVTSAALTLPAGAQSLASRASLPVPQADSADQARAAYRRGAAAFRRGDTTTARAELAHAADWWPTQQAYLETSATLAAEMHDTAGAARWLDRLAELGIGSAASLERMRSLAGAPRIDTAVARLGRATAPIIKSRVRFTLPDTTLHPEGVAFDARSGGGGGRWFVGSVRERKIVVVERDGTTRDFIAPASDGLAGVFGMAVDSTRRTLWVATTALARMDGFTPADSGRVGIYAYDLDTGRLRRKAWMTRDSSVTHTFGDVAVAPNGDVYASDSQAPWIAKLALGADSLVRFLSHPLFRSLQGMAITPDGKTMFVADYSHGLVRVDLETRSVALLGVPRGVTQLGVDGLYWHRGALIGVQNGVTPPRIVRFCLDSTGRNVRALEVLERNPAADEPTLGAIVGDSVFYVATSSWEKYGDDGKRVARIALRPPTVLGLALESRAACRP